jgi:7-carboxy-7-deazaguanine synthase
MSISPKLSNSTPTTARAGRWHERHERTRHAPVVIRQLLCDYPYQLKFVVDTPADCEEIERYLTEFPEVERQRVLLMPQGVDLKALAEIGSWLESYCTQQGYRFCPRRHIEWFGAKRGT